MALHNFITAGSYSVIDRAMYSKQGAAVSFDLDVYTNSTKSNKLLTLPFYLKTFNGEFTEFEDSVTSLPPPVAGKVYLYTGLMPDGSSVTDELMVVEDREGTLLWANAGKPRFVKNTTTGQKYVHVAGVYVNHVRGVHGFEPGQLEATFGISPQSIDGGNLLKCCYEYLKTRIEFFGVTDV